MVVQEVALGRACRVSQSIDAIGSDIISGKQAGEIWVRESIPFLCCVVVETSYFPGSIPSLQDIFSLSVTSGKHVHMDLLLAQTPGELDKALVRSKMRSPRMLEGVRSEGRYIDEHLGKAEVLV